MMYLAFIYLFIYYGLLSFFKFWNAKFYYLFAWKQINK